MINPVPIDHFPPSHLTQLIETFIKIFQIENTNQKLGPHLSWWRFFIYKEWWAAKGLGMLDVSKSFSNCAFEFWKTGGNWLAQFLDNRSLSCPSTTLEKSNAA